MTDRGRRTAGEARLAPTTSGGALLGGPMRPYAVSHDSARARRRYLYLNAFRAEPPLCSSPEEYAWSSYGATLGLVPQPHWLTIDWVLAQFGDDYESARARLKAFVDEGLTAEEPAAVGGLYIADEDFVRDTTRDMTPIPEIPRPHWQPLRPELVEIFATAEQPIATAYRGYGYTLREIAAHLGCHYSTVSRHLKVIEARV